MDNVGELSRRVSFPVYQDTRRNNIWGRLDGRKDDILIYDRCGDLTYHIPFPRSLLNRRDFQMALWDTYFSNPCNCNPAELSDSLSNTDGSQTGQGQNTNNGRSNHGSASSRGSHHHSQYQQHGSHHHHHHDDHHPRRSRRNLRHVLQRHGRDNSGQGYPNNGGIDNLHITLHRNRMAEMLSNRISKCRFEDTLCHILYSNGIRYRRRHARLVDRLLHNQ